MLKLTVNVKKMYKNYIFVPGKFQMQVLPACGHAVHEDVPDKVAEAIATFMVRHKFAEPASDFPR